MFTTLTSSILKTSRRKTSVALLLSPFLLAAGTLQAGAQHYDHQRFYNGARDGGRGGYYDRGHDYDHRYDDHRYNDQYRHDGGIGPGKGALIGGAGGAALGAIFGGGAKGALIGGGVGAGIGAIVGKSHQDHRRDRDGYYR